MYSVDAKMFGRPPHFIQIRGNNFRHFVWNKYCLLNYYDTRIWFKS